MFEKKDQVTLEDKEILLHYYPGNHSAPTQATQYVTPGEHIKLPTGEYARTKRVGIPLFDSRHFYFPRMEELELNSGTSFYSKAVHWIKCIPSFFKHWWNGITVENGEKAAGNQETYNGFAVNSSKCSLGQNTDIQEFVNSNEYIANTPELTHKLRVYFGVSRGAGATFSALAEVAMTQKIQLCLLEAPPSTLSGLFKYYGERYFRSRDLGKWLYKELPDFILAPFVGGQHKREKAFQARGHVEKFPNSIPLFIVSSKKDTTVAHESSIRLALRVAEKRSIAIKNKEEGVAPVYFLQLDKVDHNDYATSEQEDSIRYRNTLHAICREHGLPYRTEFANAGAADMRAASLLSPIYNQFLGLQSAFWRHKDLTVRHQIKREAQQSLANLHGPDVARVESIMRHSPLFAKKIAIADSVEHSEFTKNSHLP